MTDARELVGYALLVLASIFCAAHPLRAAALAARLGAEWSDEEHAAFSRRAASSATAVLVAVAWVGNVAVSLINVHTGGVRLGASLAVLVFAVGRLIGAAREAARPEPDVPACSPSEAHVPVAFGFLASPLVMGTTLVYAGEVRELWRKLVTIGCALAVGLFAWGVLRRARRVAAALGPGSLRWAAAAMDLVSVAWACDFAAIGVRDLLPLVLHTPPAR